MTSEPRPRREFLRQAGAALTGVALSQAAVAADADSLDVKAFGATGDGTTLDTAAVNEAIDAAAAAGGGTVRFPAGSYLCHSIHLKSNVGLYLEQGAVIIAADPLPAGQSGGYDQPEADQPWERYQDYGHNYWHNSLIWGVDV